MNDQSSQQIRRKTILQKIGRSVMRPFFRLVDRTHAKIASIVPTGDEFQLEYDSRKEQYIIVATYPTEEPDDYEVGHTAGKAAGMLGLAPAIAIIVISSLGSSLAAHLPQHPLVEIGIVAFTIACALYAIAALVRSITLGVGLQVRGDDQ